MTRATKVCLTVGLASGLAACSQTANFEQQTEDFIESSQAVEEWVDGDVTDADCDEPTSADVGTIYACWAEVEGFGQMWFLAEIAAEGSYTVTPQP